MKVTILNANSVQIETETALLLQSYQTIVARNEAGKLTLSPKWDCSRTTAKHVSQFLGVTAAQIRKDIKAGKILVEELS